MTLPDLGVRTSHDLRHAAEAKAHYGGNRSIGHPGSVGGADGRIAPLAGHSVVPADPQQLRFVFGNRATRSDNVVPGVLAVDEFYLTRECRRSVGVVFPLGASNLVRPRLGTQVIDRASVTPLGTAHIEQVVSGAVDPIDGETHAENCTAPNNQPVGRGLTRDSNTCRFIYMESTTYMNGQPVQIIARENRNEVWVETTDGRVLRVFKSGLSGEPTGYVAIGSLKVDTRGTDGAR